MTAASPRKQVLAQVNAAIAADARAERELTFEQRAELLRVACQAAAQLEEARARAGLPPVQPVPWPQSTWRFLKEHAQQIRKSSGWTS